MAHEKLQAVSVERLGYYDDKIKNWVGENTSDIKVRQTLSSAGGNYPILLSHSNSSDSTVNVDDAVYRNNLIYANLDSGNIQSTSYNGLHVALSTTTEGNDTIKTFTFS